MKTGMMRKGKQHNILSAVIMIMMLLVIALFSAYFIAAEADHDCCGEDCPICSMVQQCERALRETGDGMAAAAVSILPVLIFLFYTNLLTEVQPCATPVSLKIRLNN